MDIKDSYLHGTVGVVKSIDIDADKLIYKLADVASTTRTITLPLATTIANGLMSKEDKIAINSLVNYVTLDTTLIISGAKTFSSLIEFTSEDGIAPFIVTSNTVVTNLNADRLDGLHSFDFIKYDHHIDSSTTTMSTRHIGYGYAEYGFICSGPAISIGSGDGYIMQILQEINSSNTYIRYGNPDGFGAWKQLAFVGEATVSNADMLDGYHESAFLRYRGETGTDQEPTLWDSLGIKQYANALPDGLTGVYNYGEVISLIGTQARFDMYVAHTSTNTDYEHGIWVRSGWVDDKKPWRRLAFTHDTVAAAKKFVPRYITNLSTDGINEFFSSCYQADNRPTTRNYATGFTVYNDELAFTYQFAFDTYGDVHTRYKTSTEWQPWRRLAFTTDTVEVANKLSTTRYLWGQPFDGSGDVKGVIKGVPYVSFETYDYEGGSAGYVGRGGTNSNDLSITTYGENYIEFSTNSLERMRITKDGRVGIGVDYPTHRLHINGSIKAEYNPDYDLAHTIIGEAHFYVDSYSDPATGILAAIKVSGTIAQSSGNVLLCTTSGNVGIGTSTPTSKLHVIGKSIFHSTGHFGNAGAIHIQNDYAITGWDRAINIYYPNMGNGANVPIHIGVFDSEKNGGYIAYHYAGYNSNNNCMKIGLYAVDDILNVTANRCVGINTTTPRGTLDVNGSSVIDGFVYLKGNNRRIYFYNSEYEGLFIDNNGINWHDATDSFAFNIMTFSSNKRVGINTTTPEHTLDVNGSSIFRNHIYVKKYHHIFMNTGEEGVYYTDDGLYWHNANNEYVRSLIKVNNLGYVGIGTTSPNQKLTVNGSISFSPGSTATIGTCYDADNLTLYNRITINANEGGIQYNSGSWTVGDHAAHKFITGSTENVRMVIMNSTGNVGIGTTSPSAKLHVLGDGTIENGRFITLAGTIGSEYAYYHAIYGGYHGINVCEFYEDEFKFKGNGGITTLLTLNRYYADFNGTVRTHNCNFVGIWNGIERFRLIRDGGYNTWLQAATDTTNEGGKLFMSGYNGTTLSEFNVYASKSIFSGALNFANNTWNNVGDDVAIGDCNNSGVLGVKSLNSNIPGFRFYNSSNTFIGQFTVDNNVAKWNGNTLLDTNNAKESVGEFGYVMRKYTIDASALDENTWYPVTIPLWLYTTRIECIVFLDSGTKPSWSTHGNGFSVRKIWEVNGHGWGTTPINRLVYVSDFYFASTDPVRGIGQLGNNSIEYVYVRGGGKYFFYTSHNAVPTLRTSTYTANDLSVSPTTTTPATIRTIVDLYQQGYDVSTSISYLPVGKQSVICTISASGTLGFVDAIPSGRELHVIIKNTSSSAITITIPSTMINVMGGNLKIDGNSYGELNILSCGSYYVRGVS